MDRNNLKFEAISLNAFEVFVHNWFNWLINQSADISFLQETYSTVELANQWRKQWPGVAILVRKSLDFELTSSRVDNERRYLICLLYTSPSPRDLSTSRMPSSA